VQRLRRLRSEAGQATIEMLSALPVLFIGGLLVWQLCLVGIVLTSAQSAARTGARALSRGAGPPGAQRAAHDALRSAFRDGSEITAGGDTIRVKVRVPLLVPGINLPLKFVESASMPNTTA
jgi:hypothetical protein